MLLFVYDTTYLVLLVINVLPEPLHLYAGDVGQRSMQPPADRTVSPLDLLPLIRSKFTWPGFLGRVLAMELPHLLKAVFLEPFLTVYAAVDVGLQENGHCWEAFCIL